MKQVLSISIVNNCFYIQYDNGDFSFTRIEMELEPQETSNQQPQLLQDEVIEYPTKEG